VFFAQLTIRVIESKIYITCTSSFSRFACFSYWPSKQSGTKGTLYAQVRWTLTSTSFSATQQSIFLSSGIDLLQRQKQKAE